MKSAVKFLSSLAVVSIIAVGLSSAAHADVCGPSDYPRQKVFDARAICSSHRLNRATVVSESEIFTVVHFANASATPKAAEAAKLKDVAAILKSPSMRGKHVAVQGFTDSKGKDAANQRLSYHRAVNVMNILVKKYGVSASMLSAQGFGKENPVAENTTAAGRAANRRVSFAVVE